MATLTFEAARACVIEQVLRHRVLPEVETVPFEEAAWRVLAEPVTADRDFPALTRSIRDGFAARAADTPGRLRIVGEVRAGSVFTGVVGAGECVEIMTGAPCPEGADAVVMVEHAERDGDFAVVPETAAGQFLNPRGAEARAGDVLVHAGVRIGFAETAALASAGAMHARVYARPRVAILATGDEIVPAAVTPAPHQIRNSNAYSLAAQVRRAGGIAEILPVAPDTRDETLALISAGLERDLLLISGGVSAGKYDVVEDALASLGAEFNFDRVLIQPGQPLVFGRAAGRFFFGLPGNPASTMVTFEIFARAALELLAGQNETSLPLMPAALTAEFRHKRGLTRFLPARLSADGDRVTPLRWGGSSDIAALARANAYLVADAERESWSAGEFIRVLAK